MTPAEAAADLYDAGALWSVGSRRAARDVVRAACDALVAGLESPALGMLAALTAAEADLEVPELLPVVLAELGLPPLPRDGVAGEEAVATALATRLIAGGITPRELTGYAHQLFGHEPALTRRLAELDDEYDIIGSGHRTVDEVDAEVLAEARRLADRRVWPASPGC
jgi:hypothetical protein